MNDPKTQRRPDPEEFSIFRNLSNRLANVESSYIKIDQRVTDLAQQLMKIQLQRSELDRDVAMSTLDRLEESLIEIRSKREDLYLQAAQAESTTEKLVIEMMLDNLHQREVRTLQEREHALLIHRTAKEMVSDSNENIKAIKKNPPASLVEGSVLVTKANGTFMYLKDKILPTFIIGTLILILNALWEYLKLKLSTP